MTYLQALENKSISLHSKIISIFETVDQNGNPKIEKYTSTAGRFLLANSLPKNHNIKNWLNSSDTFSLIFFEYSKLIIASLRIKIMNI